MKLYSVNAIWKPYRYRYRMCKTAVIIAESEGEAIAKFKEHVSYPEGADISCYVWVNGVYTLRERKLAN